MKVSEYFILLFFNNKLDYKQQAKQIFKTKKTFSRQNSNEEYMELVVNIVSTNSLFKWKKIGMGINVIWRAYSK